MPSCSAKPAPPPYPGVSLYSSEGPNYAPPFPEGATVGAADGYGNNCLIHSISQILSGTRWAEGECSAIRPRCAAVRDALVAKRGCDPLAELELQVRWNLIVEELGGDPPDWNVLFWSGRDSGIAESAGSGGRCARMLHAAGPPGHFVPFWVDAVGNAENPRIRQEEPGVPGETKAERERERAA